MGRTSFTQELKELAETHEVKDARRALAVDVGSAWSYLQFGDRCRRAAT